MIPDVAVASLPVGMENKNHETVSPGISYKEAAKITVGKNGTYVTGVALERQGYTSFAVCTSNRTVECYSTETQDHIKTFSDHEKTISGIRYSDEDPNLLYSSCLDGNIRLWDVRMKDGPVQKYFDDTDGALKPISSFDVNLNGWYICGGTELIREDAFLVFWDKRTSKNLGGYWNSHTEDITQVKYHPHKNCVMATGSTDGLMNVFDLSQGCEDDALQYTLNTGSSVGNVVWSISEDTEMCQSQLACITHNEEVQVWNVEDANPRILLDRNNLQDHSNVQVDYLVDTLSDEYGAVYFVSGQRHGKANIWLVQGSEVSLWSNLKNGHKDDIRAVAWNPIDKTIISGGEDGVVCIWTKTKSDLPVTNYKMQSRMKELSLKHTKKPY